MATAFLAMVALVPSKSPTVTSAGAAGAPGPVAENQVASGGDQVKPCPGKQTQVPESKYSPPCFAFSGDNGGETAPQGVTATDILVGYRRSTSGDLLSNLAITMPELAPQLTPEKTKETVDAMVEYFNRNFQFYGRKIKLAAFDAKGTPLQELFNKERAGAEGDATIAADDLKVFADVSATTEPYANALARKKVIGIGAPYLSDQFFQDRRPYAWSTTPSCTVVSKALNEFSVKLLGTKPAQYAGGDLKGKPRKAALIVPDNPEYIRCKDAGLKVLHDAGLETEVILYTLDLTQFAASATSIAAKLKNDQYTTVACPCDPLLPKFLTEKAAELNYYPEWLVSGTALTDSDLTAGLYQQQEWKNAFGTSALGPNRNLKDTEAYRAFKSVRPNSEPALSVDLLYYQFYLLATGIQMAGPQLTPENFEKGMLAYPSKEGDAGRWRFGPGIYTPQAAARLIWWDANATSAQTGKKGTYKSTTQMYDLGSFPTELPEEFKK